MWNKARISDVQIEQTDVNAEVAHLIAKVGIVAAEDEDIDVLLNTTQDSKAVNRALTTHLHVGENTSRFR